MYTTIHSDYSITKNKTYKMELFWNSLLNKKCLRNIYLRLKKLHVYKEAFKKKILFVWSFSSHSRIFHSFGDSTIAVEGLQIFTYAQHWWPLSSEGSLACHTYCDTGQPFIMVISEDHLYLWPSIWHWSCHCLFLDLSRPGIEPRFPTCEANALTFKTPQLFS